MFPMSSLPDPRPSPTSTPPRIETGEPTGPMTEASKVATVTLLFWVMKICATTVGETGGDLLSMTMQIGYAASSLILIAFFLVTLAIQLRARAFHPFLYWAVILSTSTAETTISDFMDRSLGLGYATGATIIAMVLIAVLATWRFTQGSIAVDHIRNPKVETFYWVAILVSNTLGTALGHFFGLAGQDLFQNGWHTHPSFSILNTAVNAPSSSSFSRARPVCSASWAKATPSLRL